MSSGSGQEGLIIQNKMLKQRKTVKFKFIYNIRFKKKHSEGMKPTWCIKSGKQLTGLYFLITFLNFCRNTVSDFRPQKRYCFCAAVNKIYYRTSEGLSMPQIISVFLVNNFVISGEPPFTTLYMSMVRICRSLIYFEKEQAFSKSSSKVNTFSLYITLRQRWCSLFVLLFNARLWQSMQRAIAKQKIDKNIHQKFSFW